MKKEIKYCMVMAAAAMAFTACSSEETVDNSGPVEARVTAGVSGPQTRATSNSEWNGDQIGVMVSPKIEVNEEVDTDMKDLYLNVGYEAESTGPKSNFTKLSKGIFIENKFNENIVFSAYAPYKDGAENELPGVEGKITVNTKSQAEETGQTAVDYLYAYGAKADYSNPTIEFSGDNAFKHQMARLILEIKTGAGFDDPSVLEGGEIKLGGLIHDGTFDAVNGGVTVNEDATADSNWILYDGTTTGNTNVLYDYDNTTNTLTLTMILIPQPLTEALSFWASPADEMYQEYKNSSDIKPALEAGYSYKYTVTLDKTGVKVSGCEIVNWNTGTGGNASATM